MGTEILIIDKELEKCPFCGKTGFAYRKPLWNGSHGYHGNYEYFVGCLNLKCKIRPKTCGIDDIYRCPDEAIEMAVQDWNERFK